MAFSGAQNLMLVFLAITYVFATGAEASRGWGWGWGSNQTGPGSGSGWGSNQTGPIWGWPWGRGSNQTGGSGWGWGSNGGGADDQSGSWGWDWAYNGRGGGGGGGGGGSGDQSGYWGPNNQPDAATTKGPRKIAVGGSTGWRFGLDYSDWASKNAPFYVNDVLVFKYHPSAPFTRSVYLFPDLWSYKNCDLKKATMIGDTTQGSGDGFEFVLQKLQTYYFASGEQEGLHCSDGTMKFSITPIIPRWY